MRLSTVILPIHRRHEQGREPWRRAEELGVHAAYTYDHLSWRTFRDEPWIGLVYCPCTCCDERPRSSRWPE